jgi:predicted ATPase
MTLRTVASFPGPPISFHGERRDKAKLDKLEALLARAVADPREPAPLLAKLLDLDAGERYPTQDLTPQQQKMRTFQALLAQLEGRARQEPVLVVVEDAHWFDPTTMELFEAVVERLQRWPVLLVVTFRPELPPPWIRFPHVTLLTLNRLGRSDTTMLIDSIAGGRRLPPPVVDAILARTEGVPLFAEELTKTILESDLLRETDDGFELADPLPQSAIPHGLPGASRVIARPNWMLSQWPRVVWANTIQFPSNGAAIANARLCRHALKSATS